MNQEKSVIPICGLALSSFLALGCFFEVKDGDRHRPRPSSMGSLVMEWTVDDRRESRDCSRFSGGRADLELIVYRGSVEVAREYARCEDFILTVDLPPDEYRVIATLVGRSDDRPVTTSANLEGIDIVRGFNLHREVDFPATSFLF
ncbi:hypothetical protein WMF20_44455 [Sorangium sp. So ce834]|uniref:hypothetical protein n=1 Tax=Sorangium sp. So ce834 TaxID=3133321 RepID=UPI003F608D0D